MCGNLGAAGTGITRDDLDVVRELGIVSQLRGLDGAGIFEGNRYQPTSMRLVKTREDFNYLDYYETPRNPAKKNPVLGSTFSDVIIGHVRAATVGEVSTANAQPFQHGNIVGAHNGTLRDTCYRDPMNKRSDTDLFFQDISKRGLETVLRNLDDKSAYALVLYDKKEGVLKFARNAMRTLYVAFNHSRNVMYWASEADMLRLVLRRNKVNYEGYDDKEKTKHYGGIISVAEGSIWTVKIDKIKSRDIVMQRNTLYTREVPSGKLMWTDPTEEPTVLPQVKSEKVTERRHVPRMQRLDDPKDTPLPKSASLTVIEGGKEVPFDGPYAKREGIVPNAGKRVGKDLSGVCGTCDKPISVLEMWEMREGINHMSYHDKMEDVYYCYCDKANTPITADEKLN